MLRYYDHEFPVAPGHRGRCRWPSCVDAQHYRLASLARRRTSELNYRRFFDVTSLVAVRVEDPEVFDATHALLARPASATARSTACASTTPTGWPTPRGYLERLAEATGDAWVVVEKILEGDERLPDDWPCAGTTGYDALLRVGGLLRRPGRRRRRSTDLLAGAAPASRHDARRGGRPRPSG